MEGNQLGQGRDSAVRLLKEDKALSDDLVNKIYAMRAESN